MAIEICQLETGLHQLQDLAFFAYFQLGTTIKSKPAHPENKCSKSSQRQVRTWDSIDTATSILYLSPHRCNGLVCLFLGTSR